MTLNFVGSLNCAAFIAGIIEAFLNGTQFVSVVILCIWESMVQ